MIESAATMSRSARNVIAKPRQTLRRMNARISAGRDSRVLPKVISWRLLLSRVADFHRFRFLAAAILVPLESVMVFIDDLYHFADLLFHPGDGFIFPGVGKRFSGGIVIAFRRHDAGAHFVDPGSDEFLFHIVVAFNPHAFESHVFHFAVRTWHLHLPGHVQDKIASVHHRLPNRGAL